MATVEPSPPTEQTGDSVAKKSSWTQTPAGRAELRRTGKARARKRAKTLINRYANEGAALAQADGKTWDKLNKKQKLSFAMRARQKAARAAGFSNVNGIKHHTVPVAPTLRIKKKYTKTVRREQLDEWQIKGAKQDLEHYRQEVKNIETFLRLAGVDVS